MVRCISRKRPSGDRLTPRDGARVAVGFRVRRPRAGPVPGPHVTGTCWSLPQMSRGQAIKKASRRQGAAQHPRPRHRDPPNSWARRPGHRRFSRTNLSSTEGRGRNPRTGRCPTQPFLSLCHLPPGSWLVASCETSFSQKSVFVTSGEKPTGYEGNINRRASC